MVADGQVRHDVEVKIAFVHFSLFEIKKNVFLCFFEVFLMFRWYINLFYSFRRQRGVCLGSCMQWPWNDDGIGREKSWRPARMRPSFYDWCQTVAEVFFQTLFMTRVKIYTLH